MAEQKHTPGPWEAYNAGASVGTIAGKNGVVELYIADIRTKNPADARLIAAAPDLLEAGLVLLKAADEGDADKAMTGYDALRAAIAKAEG